MSFTQLLEFLSGSGSFQCARLCENLHLDFPDLASTHPLAGERGNNVAQSLAATFTARAAALADAADPDRLMKVLHETSYLLHDVGMEPHFLHPHNAHNRCADEAVYRRPFTRYLDYRAFMRRFIDPARDRGRIRATELEAVVDGFLDAVTQVDAAELARGWLGWDHAGCRAAGRPPAPVWITPAAQAPHRAAGTERMDEAARARWVVRGMALPGYGSRAQREERIGLVAVIFDLEAGIDLYKPTVLDAVDSPLFLPGPHAGCCGLTYLLQEDLRTPAAYPAAGHDEYICMPFKVPVKVGDTVKVERVGRFRE